MDIRRLHPLPRAPELGGIESRGELGDGIVDRVRFGRLEQAIRGGGVDRVQQ